jgi:hypothetical protein
MDPVKVSILLPLRVLRIFSGKIDMNTLEDSSMHLLRAKFPTRRERERENHITNRKRTS